MASRNGRKPPNPLYVPKQHGRMPKSPLKVKRRNGRLPVHPYSVNPQRYAKAIGKKPASKFPTKLMFFVIAVIVIGVLYLQAMQT